jgi:hypothetical protein
LTSEIFFHDFLGCKLKRNPTVNEGSITRDGGLKWFRQEVGTSKREGRGGNKGGHNEKRQRDNSKTYGSKIDIMYVVLFTNDVFPSVREFYRF